MSLGCTLASEGGMTLVRHTALPDLAVYMPQEVYKKLGVYMQLTAYMPLGVHTRLVVCKKLEECKQRQGPLLQEAYMLPVAHRQQVVGEVEHI